MGFNSGFKGLTKKHKIKFPHATLTWDINIKCYQNTRSGFKENACKWTYCFLNMPSFYAYRAHD